MVPNNTLDIFFEALNSGRASHYNFYEFSCFNVLYKIEELHEPLKTRRRKRKLYNTIKWNREKAKLNSTLQPLLE
jgi:hypothetical protein